MSPLTIHTSWWQLIDTRARLTPERPFLSDERGRALSFGQYRDLAEEVAAGLATWGVRSDHVVSWQLATTIEAAVLMAALCRLGVRQNPIIPILRRAEVSLITAQVGSTWRSSPEPLEASTSSRWPRKQSATASARSSTPATTPQTPNSPCHAPTRRRCRPRPIRVNRSGGTSTRRARRQHQREQCTPTRR